MLKEQLILAKQQEQVERDILVKAEEEFKRSLALSEALYSRKVAHLSTLSAPEQRHGIPEEQQWRQLPSAPPLSQQAPPRPLLDDCPVCLDALERNVFSCTKCHRLFCESCSSQVDRCPLCRENFRHGVNPLRNEAIEMLLQRQ